LFDGFDTENGCTVGKRRKRRRRERGADREDMKTRESGREAETVELVNAPSPVVRVQLPVHFVGNPEGVEGEQEPGQEGEGKRAD
jgi:hypothetical protein